MENKNDDDGRRDQSPVRRGPNRMLIVMALGLLAAITVISIMGGPTELPLNFFEEQVRSGNVLKVKVVGNLGKGVFNKPPKAPAKFDDKGAVVTESEELLPKTFSVRLSRSDAERAKLLDMLREHNVQIEIVEATNSAFMLVLLLLLVPIGLLLFFWLFYRRSQNQLMGGGFLSSFSKSPAKRYESAADAITFKDVAGIESVKADLMEIVDYLKSPEKFQRLGGRVPQGVLLNGPPGTGKTLLARAVAGEADVPFYSVNGSEFIQMFVGVGASRVRDLFKTAKEHSPAIIFVDEIDAVGRQRGAGLGGGHDEREQTLNQILSEMDGFDQTDSVIVMAATNRPDVLDPALLRPGRFDRHITVGRPTQKGRVEIFKVHVRKVPLSDDVDLERLGGVTIGLTGADLRNIVNEAALWAARQDKSIVEMEDFEYAREKVLIGAKREEVLSESGKEKTAYHEAGHALSAWLLPGADRVHKVTIIPRDRALGVTQLLPTEERRLTASRSELNDELVCLLAGRAAELLVYNEMCTGAASDIERATAIVRRMVTSWGMSERIGPVSCKLSDDDPFLGREIHQQRAFSEHTLELVDNEVARILAEQSERASHLLRDNRDKLELLAQELLAREELSEDEIRQLIGPSSHHLREAEEAEHENAVKATDSNGDGAEEGNGDGGETAGGEDNLTEAALSESSSGDEDARADDSDPAEA